MDFLSTNVIIALISINTSLTILLISKVFQIEKRVSRIEGFLNAIFNFMKNCRNEKKKEI